MAHDALYASLQVLTMRPGHSRRQLINAHPRNRLGRLGKFGQLHDCWPILRDRLVAHHARGGGRKRHLDALIGISVALLALQTQRQVSLMAVGKGLRRCRVLRKVVGHLLFGGYLLRLGGER